MMLEVLVLRMNREHQEARSRGAGRSIRRGGGGAQEGGAYSGGERTGTLVVSM